MSRYTCIGRVTILRQGRNACPYGRVGLTGEESSWLFQTRIRHLKRESPNCANRNKVTPDILRLSSPRRFSHVSTFLGETFHVLPSNRDAEYSGIADNIDATSEGWA